MQAIENEALRFAIDDLGHASSFVNKLSGHEYIVEGGELFKLIYAEKERTEIPVFASGQAFSVKAKADSMDLVYDGLQGDGRRLDVKLTLHFHLTDESLVVSADLVNHDKASIMEISLTALGGSRFIDGDGKDDYIAWPDHMGKKIPQPALRDLSVYAGFRKYERHDHLHTDLDCLYPARMSMQWYDWTNGREGLYIGSHDTTGHTKCAHVERSAKTGLLQMGFIFYPMIETDEVYVGTDVVYQPHLGDWHTASKIYRAFMEESGYLKLTEQRPWAKEFKGWLRVILKPHHCELNWDYHDIPMLFDDARSAGLDTLFLLGWEKGGFARMWPDYEADERMGGEKVLKEGIEYVHSKGGKVIMFLSYSLIDHQSDFYKNGPGEECTMKTIWGDEIPFSETYCGEATYRKIPNPPMPMYMGCPGSDKWQDKMLKSADYLCSLGADGVLYDLGGLPAYFCYDKRHNHTKPSHSMEQKSQRFAQLRDRIREDGEDSIILMEHTVDIFNMNMDIVQGTNKADRPDDLIEMYRYTFPEFVITNRESGQDQDDYRTMVNRSVILGLRFDMTIFRCCGLLKDIPLYRDYLVEVNRMLDEHKDTLLLGSFRDQDGFAIDNSLVKAKSFESKEGHLEVVVWNPADEDQQVTVELADRTVRLCVKAQSLAIA